MAKTVRVDTECIKNLLSENMKQIEELVAKDQYDMARDQLNQMTGVVLTVENIEDVVLRSCAGILYHKCVNLVSSIDPQLSGKVLG